MAGYSDSDYQSLIELRNSHGWKLLCDELDNRITDIEKVLKTPNLKTILNISDAANELNLINHKREELIYLENLKNMPNKLLSTKIKTGK